MYNSWTLNKYELEEQKKKINHWLYIKYYHWIHLYFYLILFEFNLEFKDSTFILTLLVMFKNSILFESVWKELLQKKKNK